MYLHLHVITDVSPLYVDVVALYITIEPLNNLYPLLTRPSPLQHFTIDNGRHRLQQLLHGQVLTQTGPQARPESNQALFHVRTVQAA